MNYLTPSALAARAPAAQPLGKNDPGLIDTAAFIRFIERELGHLPVAAIQGRPHSDVEKKQHLAKRERQGRHLIVCTDHRGAATILLNSHTVRRKAWIAAGFYRGSTDRPLLFVGAAVPLRRWRGFRPAIEELERYRPAVANARKLMVQHTLTSRSLDQLAEKISDTAYLPDHKPIAPEHLITAAPPGANLWETMFRMLGKIVDGNLPAANPEGRKVKPVRGPDALMHAGNAVFNAGAELLGCMALPTYRKT